MRKNIKRVRLLKVQLFILTLLLICIFVGAGSIVRSYSWFSINKVVEGKEKQIFTEDGGEAIIGDYAVFIRSKTEAGNKTYTVMNSLNNVTMSTYDSVFGRNADTAIILRIPVSGTYVDGGQALSFSLSRKNTDELNDYCSDEYGLNAKITNTDLNIEEGKIINYLTNIATFRFAIIPSLNSYSSSKENAQTIYDGAESYFKLNSIETKTFATQTKLDKTYTVTKTTNEISWSIGADYGEGSLTGDGELYVYIEIDYDKYLVAAYLQNHKDNFAVGKLGQTQMLSFVGDLNMLEVTSVSAQ